MCACVARLPQAPPGHAEPQPVTARNSHAAVAIDRDLYVFSGDNAGDMLREYAMVDTADAQVRMGRARQP